MNLIQQDKRHDFIFQERTLDDDEDVPKTTATRAVLKKENHPITQRIYQDQPEIDLGPSSARLGSTGQGFLGQEKKNMIYEPGVRRKSKPNQLPILKKMSVEIKKTINISPQEEESEKQQEPKKIQEVRETERQEKKESPPKVEEKTIFESDKASEKKKRAKKRLLASYQDFEEGDQIPLEVKTEEKSRPTPKPVTILQEVVRTEKEPINQIKIQKESPKEHKMNFEKESNQNSPDKHQNYLSLHSIMTKEFNNRKEFLLTPIKQGCKLQVTIKRDKGGLGLYPQYEVFMSNQYRFLVNAKKQSGNATSNYHISTGKNEFEPELSSYIGKVRSNFMCSSYQIYNDGCNPEKKLDTKRNSRKILASVHFEGQGLGSKHPRKMEVYIPKNSSVEAAPQKDLKEQWETEPHKFIALVSKMPQWNESKQIYVLDFKGRVQKPSIKNFILARKDDQQSLVMLFGRVDEDVFNLDVMAPLSPLQAFGIVITSFDTKVQ